MERQNSIPRVSIPLINPLIEQAPVTRSVPVYRQDPVIIEQPIFNTQPMRNNSSESIWSRLQPYVYRVLRWHVKHCPESRTLIVYRVISIILFLILTIVDTVAFSVPSNPPSIALQFLWAANYPLYEIATIIYCSGAAVFGISFEIYPFVLISISNVILQSKNCGEVQLTVVFLVRVICLGAAVELAHWNFRRLCDDYASRKKSSHVMLHQSLLFSISILFFASPGLRIVYDGALNKCEFQHFSCGLIDMDAPAFDPHSSCDPSFIDYVSSREELRILRDWLLLNIAFYAIFNRALLDLSALRSARAWWFVARLTILILFFALATSFLVVNIAPFQLHKTKIVFDVIECVLFVCTVLLMIYNLIRTGLENPPDGNNDPFQQEPIIFPKA